MPLMTYLRARQIEFLWNRSFLIWFIHFDCFRFLICQYFQLHFLEFLDFKFPRFNQNGRVFSKAQDFWIYLNRVFDLYPLVLNCLKVQIQFFMIWFCYRSPILHFSSNSSFSLVFLSDFKHLNLNLNSHQNFLSFLFLWVRFCKTSLFCVFCLESCFHFCFLLFFLFQLVLWYFNRTIQRFCHFQFSISFLALLFLQSATFRSFRHHPRLINFEAAYLVET